MPLPPVHHIKYNTEYPSPLRLPPFDIFCVNYIRPFIDHNKLEICSATPCGGGLEVHSLFGCAHAILHHSKHRFHMCFHCTLHEVNQLSHRVLYVSGLDRLIIMRSSLPTPDLYLFWLLHAIWSLALHHSKTSPAIAGVLGNSTSSSSNLSMKLWKRTD